jgi:hypothetical protein
MSEAEVNRIPRVHEVAYGIEVFHSCIEGARKGIFKQACEIRVFHSRLHVANNRLIVKISVRTLEIKTTNAHFDYRTIEGSAG